MRAIASSDSHPARKLEYRYATKELDGLCGRDEMIDRIKKNWGDALAEVGVSVAGTLGVVFLIALIFSQQTSGLTIGASFGQYFQGGQISLPILSLSGIIFLTMFRKHGRPHPVLAWALFSIFFLPVIGTAFMMGLNPGFEAGGLGPTNLLALWSVYGAFHLLWFSVLIFEPIARSQEEAGEEQEERIKRIKAGAAQRA